MFSRLQRRSNPAMKAILRTGLAVVGVFALLITLFPASDVEARDVRDITKTKKSTLEQAKDATSDLSAGTFVPPPRSVADITDILSKQERDDQKSVATSTKIADTRPPQKADSDDLAEFYYDRALAASRLGRSGQEIADFRLANSFARKARNDDVLDMSGWLLGLADLFAGSFSQAVTDWEDAVKVSKNLGWEEDMVLPYAILADLYARAGDPEGVKRAAELSKKAQQRAGNDMEYLRPSEKAANRAEWAACEATRKAAELEVAGRFAEAEPFRRKAVEGFQKYLDTTIREKGDLEFDDVIFNWFHANVTDNLRRQGRLVEAEVWSRRALIYALKLNGRYSAHTLYMLERLARVVYEQGRFADAETLARAAVDGYRKDDTRTDSVAYAEARITLADARVAQENWADALTEYEAVKKALSQDPYVAKRFVEGNLNWGIALLETGKADEAIKTFADAETHLKSVYGEGHYAVAEVLGLRARALMVGGHKAQAIEAFKTAVPILLEGARLNESQGGGDTTRNHNLRGLLESYIDLLAEVRGSELEKKAGADIAAETFRIADAARTRGVQSALSASGARAAAKDPALADLVRREQDAKLQADSQMSMLADILSRPTGEQPKGAEDNLRKSIDQLRTARTTILQEINKRFPDYAELISPKPATVAQIRQDLRTGEALIATYIGNGRTYVWTIPVEGDVALNVAKIGRGDLTDTVSLLRAALEPNAQTLGDIPEFDLEMAHDLYRQLLLPSRPSWESAKSLLVVADGALGYLPFSLLPTEPVKLAAEGDVLFANYQAVPWLVRSHAVTVLPSVASLKTLRALPPGDADRKAFAGFGDPYFSQAQANQGAVKSAALASRGLTTRGLPVRLRAAPKTAGLNSAELARLPRLPDTADEVRSIGVALKADLTQDVFLGKRASEDAIKSMNLSGYKVLAFATHGLVPGDLNGLTQPALALSSPQVSGGQDDGLLTMGEILGLRLDADWVVLSACNTGSGQGAGAEAVSGLGRAFFYAGTRALLVSNWPVETTSAKILTTDLFSRQAANANLSRAEALRQSMIALMDGPGFVDPTTGKAVYSYAHPLFWGPFTLIGDGG